VSKSGGLDALLELPDSLKKRYKEQADRCPMQFLYDGLGITTTCESGYRASVNPRLHIEFALMRLAFLMKKAESAPAPIVQAPAPAAPAAPQPIVQQPVAAAQPAPQPEVVQPAATQQPEAKPATEIAEQPRERRTRATRATAGLSMKSVMSDEQRPQEPTVPKEAPAPSEEEIKEKWPELALRYKHLDRLCSMLNTTTLSFQDTGDFKTVIFRVVNEAQKTWVETKMLHDLEGNLRAIMKSMKIYLRVEVTPDDAPQEKKIYMPSEQAGVLMKENSEVNGLIKDLGLDIK
jgi:DNA polymerase-3 subunit gamma/tau